MKMLTLIMNSAYAMTDTIKTLLVRSAIKTVKCAANKTIVTNVKI